MIQRCSFSLLGLIFVCLIGCADDGLVNVAGEVSIDGTPVVQGTISFLPTDSKGATAEAVIKDAAYSVAMPKGEKKVVIRGYQKVGEQFPWGKDNPPADILKEIVPKEFNDDSDVKWTASKDDQNVNFELNSK